MENSRCFKNFQGMCECIFFQENWGQGDFSGINVSYEIRGKQED